jgi:uncharacterized Zn-finger protein
MKANFILRKDNTPRFIKALRSILSATGYAVFESEYVGKNQIASMLTKKGIKRTSFLMPVVNTHPVYSKKSSARIVVASFGVQISMNETNGGTYEWGTKMRITSNRIYVIEPASYSLPRHITTIRSFGNPNEAESSMMEDAMYAHDYYDSMMNDY